MTTYNLDEKKGILGFFRSPNPSKVLDVGHRLTISHYSMFDSVNAFVVGVNNYEIKIKFRNNFPELDFFIDDPIVINCTEDYKLYVLSGEINDIEIYSPLLMSIKVNSIERKYSNRKNERFHVSVAGKIKVLDCPEPFFCIIKNLSLGGFKLNCKYDLSQGMIVDLDAQIDNYYSVTSRGKIVRKNKVKDYFEYGVEITEISETSNLTFKHYINRLIANI